MDNASGALNFHATIDNRDFKRDVSEMESRIKGMTGTVRAETSKMDAGFKTMIAGAVGVFTIQAAAGFRQKLIEVRGEFQKYQAVLANSLGTQKDAAEAMQMLADFASKTPFQLDRLTSAYVKLVNQGFKPSIEQMRSLGDLASSTGKEFEQLAEAILDAQTGEFERLKEFGVKAAVSGDKITFAFKNVKTTVDNSAESIRNYILSLGQMQGVKGAMAAISGTLVGQVSNLQDSITSMFNEIGQKSEGFLSKSIQSTAWLVENYEKIGKAVGALIITYGAYKAAVIVHSAVITAAANASKGLTVAMQLQMRATLLLQKAQALLNKTMLANPWVALATIIIGAVAAIAIFMDRTTSAERAQKQFNDRVDELNGLQEENRAKNEELLGIVTDVTRADFERVVALGELQKKYPEIFAQYDIETIMLTDILHLMKLVNEERGKEAVATNQGELEKAQADVKRLEAELAAWKPDPYDVTGADITYQNELIQQLEDARKYLKKWEENVQKDRNNVVLANLKEYTTDQIQQEYAQRKSALEQMAKLDVQDITVSGGILEGKFDVAELQRQTAALETELNKRNAKVYDYTELQKYYSDQLIEKQKELDKVYASKDKMSTVDWNKKVGELKGAIKEIEKAQTLLSEKTGKVTTDVDKKSFDDLLNYKKQKYDEYYTWLDAFGKESAQQEYATLMTEGATFSDYLQKQIDSLQAKKDNLTTVELANLHILQLAYANQINIEKELADEKKKREEEAEKATTDALLEEYAGYLSDKLRFEVNYLANKKRLTLAIERATNAEELALAIAALDALEKKKKQYDTLSGDVEYDTLLKQYQDFEDKRNEIINEYSAARQKAAENNDLELFDKLVEGEKKALSKLSSEELMSSDAWTTLFERLDRLSVKELLRLKDTIEGQFKDLDLTPTDLQALRERLDETTDQILKKNPFKALKEALEDYKKTEDKEDLSDAFVAIGASIGAINDIFKQITSSLETLGVTMDDVAQGIMDGISGILEGAADLATGIGTQNPLQAIQGAISFIASGIDLIWGTKDRKILRSIENQQKEVEKLTQAYNRLEDAIQNALGTDIFSLQTEAINNLKEQNDELQKMYEDEDSRKKADKEKLTDYSQQIYENEQRINDIQAQMAEQIVQTTAKTAADQLMDALVGAWEAGEDAAKAFGETAKDVMKQAAINAIKLQFIEKPMQKAIENLQSYMGHWEGANFVFDGLTQQEQDMFRQQMLAIGETAEGILEMFPDLFKGTGIDAEEGGLTGAIKGVSEETATLIAGQMNAIRLSQAQSLDILRNHLIALNGIKENTDVLPESLTQLRTIAGNTSGALSLFSGTGIKVRY